jgi:hypothetical protein
MNFSLTPELEKLETQLLQSVESLDTGNGVSGEEVIRRLRKRIKESHALHV